MPNYNLVTTARYKPFTFDELLKPALMATQAHRELEDAYTDLTTQAATIESMANAQSDPESYAAYQNYANALKNQVTELAANGLTPASRSALLNMRRRYAQEVLPIQDAYNRRDKQAKLQAEILAKDPTHIFGRMASTTSLDDYRKNKNLDLTLENYSGALLTQQVSKEAEALAKAARNDPNVRTQLRHLLGYNYETIRQTGFSPEAIQEAILRSPDANPILTGIVDRVMEGSGIGNWTYASPEEKQRIWNQARDIASQGLWSAVGQTQYGTVVDDAAKMAAEYDNAVNLAREKYKIEHPEDPNDREPSRGWNFLEVNGDLQGYKDLQSKLSTENGGLKASYFGKRYVNPMKVYEEATAAYEKAAPKEAINSPLGGKVAEIGKKARDAVLKKYGVSSMLTPQEYKHLKDLGYTTESTYNDFRNDYSRKVNERASQWRHESVNLNETALQERGNTLRGYLQYLEDNDNWSGQAFKMSKDGSLGKAVKSLKDLGIKDLSKASLTDVFYSRQAPGMIHARFGDTEFYIDPNGFGAESASLIQDASKLLNLNDAQLKAIMAEMYKKDINSFTAEQARDFIAQDTTAKLRDLLRGYNKGRSNTDSGI